jgi:hypothetical protein
MTFPMAHRVISRRCGIWSLSGIADIERTSLQLQPQIFSQHIFSIEAVARYPLFLCALEDPWRAYGISVIVCYAFVSD